MLPRRFALALSLAVPFALSSFSLAAPPSDDAIDALIKKVETAKGEDKTPAAIRQARRDAAADALSDTPLSEATFAQLKKIYDKRITAGNNELCEAMDARLVELARGTTLDAAKAAEMRIAVLAPAEPTADGRKAREAKLAALTEDALKAPAVGELFKSGGGDGIVRAASALSADSLKDRKIFELLAPHITTEMTPSAAMALSSLVQPLVGAKDSLGQEKFDSIRSSIARAAEAATDKAIKFRDEHATKLAAEPKPTIKDGESDEDFAKRVEKETKVVEAAKSADESQVTRLKDLQALASGPWARGELVDHPAPAISFIWSNTDKPIHSFADLKGKVVMVDFWATWCGPCRAAFPKMRELQTRYSGYPVVILGVTSPQGFSMDYSDKKKPNRIDCKGDVAKETGLMKAFMADQEMTWNVAFSDQNVFNPDFGVRGIPSVANIGPDGNVRFAGLYPDPKAESEHIDALLKEAKLPYPENPFVETPKADKKDETKKDEPKKG